MQPSVPTDSSYAPQCRLTSSAQCSVCCVFPPQMSNTTDISLLSPVSSDSEEEEAEMDISPLQPSIPYSTATEAIHTEMSVCSDGISDGTFDALAYTPSSDSPHFISYGPHTYETVASLTDEAYAPTNSLYSALQPNYQPFEPAANSKYRKATKYFDSINIGKNRMPATSLRSISSGKPYYKQTLGQRKHAEPINRHKPSETPHASNNHTHSDACKNRRRSPSYDAYKRPLSPSAAKFNTVPSESIDTDRLKETSTASNSLENKNINASKDHSAEAKRPRKQKSSYVDKLNIQDITISTSGGEIKDIPKCMQALEDVKTRLGESVYNCLVKEGFESLTPIQRYAIPIIQEGYDVVACAQTGSGKTLAFVCPLISMLISAPPVSRPFFDGHYAQVSPLCLILCPTRELALQIQEQVLLIASELEVRSMAVYGGANAIQQVSEINQHQIDVLTATPGRLLDLIDACKVSLGFVKYFVFDEADIMLSMGFEKQIGSIVLERDLPDNDSRQTLLFSATFSSQLKELIYVYLKTPFIRLSIGPVGTSNATILQVVRRVEDSEKLLELRGDLKLARSEKCIVFVSRRNIVYSVLHSIRQWGFSAEPLHGKLEQEVREQVFNDFRMNRFDILVATSIAARGLDFPDVNLVINYDMPNSIDQYTHRIGRTGRIGNNGLAISYFTRKDRHLMSALAQELKRNRQHIPQWMSPPSMRHKRY